MQYHIMPNRSLCLLIAVSLLVSACGVGTSPKHSKIEIEAQKNPLLNGAETMVQPQSTVQSRGVIKPGTTPVKVALLVPLSGEAAPVGKAMMDAANMALYDSYLSVPSDEIRSQVVLLPKDTGSTPASAARASQQAVDQGAKFIIGPLFSQSVARVRPIAASRGVNMLAFSNTREIAKPGTFIFGFLPEQQVQRIADYAFLKGYSRVALLAPNDAYGQRIQEVLLATYGRKGGLVKPVEQYAPSPTNIEAAVGRLAAYNDSNKDQAFQAIFIADGGFQLRNIVSALKKTNIDLNTVKLIGTGLWDDKEITKIPEMRGAWFSSSPPHTARAFERRFNVLYGYRPVRLASLAYDAVNLTAQLTMHDPSGTLDVKRLTNPEGYHTPANGLVRIRPAGTNERKLAIMEVTPTGFRVIDRAPDSFDTPGMLLP